MIAKYIARRIVDRWKDETKQINNLLAELSDKDRQHFEAEYGVRKNSVAVGYLCWWLLGCHYLYVKRPVKQLIFWGTLGGLFVWYLLDLFLMYFVIDRFNRELALEIVQEIMEANSQTDEQWEGLGDGSAPETANEQPVSSEELRP